jgi:hypothetical protein
VVSARNDRQASQRDGQPQLTVALLAKQRAATAAVGRGQWILEGDELILRNAAGDEWLLFGDRSWKDYDFSFEVLQEGFPSGISLLFRSPDDTKIQNFGFGWHNHKTSVMQYAEKGQSFQNLCPLKILGDSIQSNRWYELKVVVRGKSTNAYCDGKLIFEIDNNLFNAGRVGVRTWKTWPPKTRFRNIKVSGPDGAVLWAGPPELGRPVE